MFSKVLIPVVLSGSFLFAQTIETFYGPLEVEEPVILELIECPAFQRLKDLHQYGVAYYISHTEPYNRFDHSVGVFAVLRLKGASLEEQIAGLLHDVSHTIFSHVGDYIFNQLSDKNSYQDDIHDWFLNRYGFAEILAKHGYTVQDIHHKSGRFIALDAELPDLNADRIDYNIQGGYYQGFFTKEEARELVDDLQFDGKRWISKRPDLAKKCAQFSFYMTHNCWGSPHNFITCRWLADAILRAHAIGLISKDEIHFSSDTPIWERLLQAEDPEIQRLMDQIFHVNEYVTFVDPSQGDFEVKMKFRGVDPWIETDQGIKRLTEVDPEAAEEFQSVKAMMRQGWSIKLLSRKL
jgi:HD superfamily phosphohydrolase